MKPDRIFDGPWVNTWWGKIARIPVIVFVYIPLVIFNMFTEDW